MIVAPEKRISGKLFVLGMGGILVAMTVYTFWPRPPKPKSLSSDARYGAVIEAAGGDSKIRIYEWMPVEEEEDVPPWVELATSEDGAVWTHTIQTGLQDFAEDPTSAGESLTPLIEFARQKMRDAGRKTLSVPIWLFATEALRAVPEPQLGEVLADVRLYLTSTGFPIEAIEILDPEGRAALATFSGDLPATDESWSRGAMIQGAIHLSK